MSTASGSEVPPPEPAEKSGNSGNLVAIIVAVIAFVGTLGNSISQFWASQKQATGAFDSKMVEIGINILSADPSKTDISPAREWAVRLVEQHAGLEFSEQDKQDLLHHPIREPTFYLPNPSLPGGLARAGCQAWARNSDGSWTTKGKIVTSGNTFDHITLKGGIETRWLDENCAQ